MVAKKLDVHGRACPIPIVELMRAVKQIEVGQEIEIRADDRAFPADVKAWCQKTGHTLVELADKGDAYVALVRKKTGS
jgi:tRNA 2-thiouridine synthesizing protein A